MMQTNFLYMNEHFRKKIIRPDFLNSLLTGIIQRGITERHDFKISPVGCSIILLYTHFEFIQIYYAHAEPILCILITRCKSYSLFHDNVCLFFRFRAYG